MLFNEPPYTQWDLHFVLLGIPVRVHPFFWLVAVLLGTWGSGGAWPLLSWVAAVFLSILIHELGHALAMRSYGFSPSIVLYGMGGLTSFGPGGTSRRGPGAWGHVLISAAGPGAGFLLAAAIVAALRLSGHQVLVLPGLPMGVMVLLRDEVGSPLLTDFINQVLWVSVAWGIVNLLPVFPLDGGQIARELLVRYNPWDGIRQSLVLSFITALILVAVGLAYYDLFIAILFGYLAYSSYAMLRGYGGRRF